MSVTQYIGARYVPKFAEPIDWDINKEYEPLTIVYYGGNSYTSKQAVPKNIQLDNEEYWVLTGNYNAQIEQYRKEVKSTTDTANQALTLAKTNEQDIATNDAELAGTADSGLKTLITDNKTETDAAIAEKSPISHASAETTYGVGSDTKYGHVKLTDSVVSTEGADSGKAVTGKAVAAAIADNVSRYKNILCIGDSYLEGFSPDGNVTPWGTVLRNLYGCDGHNTALGGTGFVNKVQNKNFTNLINDAAAGTGYDTDFDCVIIGGGFNDRGIDASSIAAGVKSALDAVYQHWPNAAVYVFGFMWGCKGYGASTEAKSKAAQDAVNS